jgi:hypothetical protein
MLFSPKSQRDRRYCVTRNAETALSCLGGVYTLPVFKATFDNVAEFLSAYIPWAVDEQPLLFERTFDLGINQQVSSVIINVLAELLSVAAFLQTLYIIY